MLRASTKPSVARLKAAGACPKSNARPLQAQICTSLVDPPLFVPGYDFLGNQLNDNDDATKVTKDKEVEATNAVVVHQPGWFSILPKSLLPKEGTTYYETYMTTSKSVGTTVKETQIKPGFLQRVLYGVPEDVLARTTVESVKETITKTTVKTGLWQKDMYEVDGEETIAKGEVAVAKEKQDGGKAGKC